MHTTKAGLDGKWAGATHGDSYFFFTVDPGVHHLCAATQFGMSSADSQTALLHFTAVAGGVYYVEVKNYSWLEKSSHDVTLSPLDSDQGIDLISRLPRAVSTQKK